MFRLKICIILLAALVPVSACFDSTPPGFVISESKEYKASIYRQNCAICHGPEGEGKTLTDGTVVPSLRTGEFKMKTRPEIHKQITEGGNGMTPFSRILTERELQMVTDLVYKDLRGN